MTIIDCLLVITSLIIIIICIIALFKNNNTLKQRQKIGRAICDYHMATEVDNWQVDYTDVEDYDKTLFRIWDWGYTNILPKEKFEIIKPFIIEV